MTYYVADDSDIELANIELAKQVKASLQDLHPDQLPGVMKKCAKILKSELDEHEVLEQMLELINAAHLVRPTE